MRNNLENVVRGIKRFAGAAVLAAGISLAFGCANPAGPSKPSAPDYSTEIAAITKGAENLSSLQNSDGGWEWIVTTPKSASTGNIAGVTAEGLLVADKVNNNSQYLSDAENAGLYIESNYDGNGAKDSASAATFFTGIETTDVKAFNIKFLYDLGNISGNNSYTKEANALMDKVIQTYTTAASLVSADQSFRGSGNGYGIIPWDLFGYIQDAKSDNNNPNSANWASDLVSKIKALVPLSSSDLTYIIGLAGRSMSGDTSATQALQSAQKADGTWNDPNGAVQDTAYAVMALVKAGDMTDAYKGVQAGMKRQTANGGWIESDSNEYTEVDSEVIQAISAYIGK